MQALPEWSTEVAERVLLRLLFCCLCAVWLCRQSSVECQQAHRQQQKTLCGKLYQAATAAAHDVMSQLAWCADSVGLGGTGTGAQGSAVWL
jgi:hypothetical protein